VAIIDLNNHKVEITYPTNWKYKLIIKGKDNKDKIFKDEIKKILNNKKYSLSLSNISSKNKFKSFTLSLKVDTEDERKDIYKKLLESSLIIRVL